MSKTEHVSKIENKISVCDIMKNNTSEIIKKQKWEKYFQISVFGNETKYSKPDPEIYRLALIKTATKQEEVMVIEDSINGVKSAKAAGIFTIGFANNHSEKELLNAGADKIITKLEEILQITDTDNSNKYKIIATGNIDLQEIKSNPQTERLIDENKKAIEDTWLDASKNKKMFNGVLLNICEINKKKDKIEINGNFVEYKNFFAQTKTGLDLGIKPIGVSGITIFKEANTEYVIIAKRSENVTQYPNFFELVPSGSIDKKCINTDGTIDYKSKLLSEFTEETGLSKNLVKDISSFVFVLDTDHNVYDIGCKILLDAEKKLIEEKFKDSEEYSDPIFIAVNELNNFVKTQKNLIVPTSMALINAYINKK